MRYLFIKGWKFLETKAGTGYSAAMEKAAEFNPVQIPHDWMIYGSTDLYRDSTGWYVRELDIDTKEGRYFLEFDAVYMDSKVFVNGVEVCEWKYGYSAFDCEITEQIREGKNIIAVGVTYMSPNTRWYSGAGIIRNVYIRQTGETYIAKDGVYVSNRVEDGRRILHFETEVKGKSPDKAVIGYTVTDTDGNEITLNRINDNDFEIADPHLWDIDDPYLYRLKVTMNSGEDTDEAIVTFGIRDIEFDPEKGFLLNGRNFKLNGVCEHHDLGALGAAFNKCAMRRKLRMLRTMGVNALRTSHNMPAPEVLDLCDEMGFVVMTECFDMWYRPKTEYDYARFFGEWHERDMESWVRQDRNHPSVIMWSIGNEIYDVHADENAPETVRHLMDVVYRFDPYKNAICTFASNFMPWEGGQKCGDVLKLVGYNYSENIYKEHHEKYPDWIIYGSETASLVQSRGVYKFPLSVTRLSDEDEQCSALGNCNTSWGAKSIEACICDDRDMDFSAGQFLWTGFDYIGEPTPYHTRNSYFGMIDTAGFPKDYYYVFRSAWTDPKTSPMIHIFPYWDFNPGQMIDVRVCSNEDTVELFLGTESLGVKHLTHKPGSGHAIIADYKVPYKKGDLHAVGYDSEGNITCTEYMRSFGDSATIEMEPDTMTMRAGSDDLIFVEIYTRDAAGNPVMNASDRINITVTGPGRLVGLDNGDSTDIDYYKGRSRRLFNGKLLAIIAPGDKPGTVVVGASGTGLMDGNAVLECTAEAVDMTLGGYVAYPSPFDEGASEYLEENKDLPVLLGSKKEVPVRKIEIISDDRKLTADKKEANVKVKIYPEDATDKDVIFKAVSDKGVPVNYAEIESHADEVLIRAKGDGEFRLRCMSGSGTGSIRVISELEFEIEGVGKAVADPYDFVYGSSYTYSEGEIGAGNEMGYATARGERSLVGFENVDFGKFGSAEFTMPVFALDSDAHPFRVYDGIPSDGGKLIGEFVYQKPSIWNVYQEDTWELEEPLKGLHTLCFEFDDKIHVKGFSFTAPDKAFMYLKGADADEMYGDDFIVNGHTVEGIGNNVTINFTDMDFGEKGTCRVLIKGRAPKGTNTIHVRFFDENGESRNVIEFAQCDELTEREFEIEKTTGMKNVSFVFMPGSCFDLAGIKFL